MSEIKEELMKRKPFGRRGLRALLVSAAALAGAIPLPAAASANTYTVSSCNNGVNHAWAPYWNSGVSNITLGAACPGEYAPGKPSILYNQGLFVRNISNTSYTPPGTYGGLRLTAPGGNSLASISGDWWVTRAAGSGFYAAILGDWSRIDGCWACSCLCGADLKGRFVRRRRRGGRSARRAPRAPRRRARPLPAARSPPAPARSTAPARRSARARAGPS